MGAALAIALFAAITFVSEDDGDSDETSAVSSSTTAARVVVTGPKEPTTRQVEAFCAAPAALPDVPAHDPAKPSTVFLSPSTGPERDGNGQAKAPDGTGVGDADIGPRPALTAVSPQPDGVVINDIERIDGTRTVACIDFVELRGTGQQCAYSGSGPQNLFDESTHELATSRWKIDVYELHSGTRLTGGELSSHAGACPESISVASTTEPVHYSLTNQEIADWLGTRFPEGVPQ